MRKELTDEWKERGIKEGLEFAILTDEITKAWSWKSVKLYKKFKGLKKESLRDNMTNLELVLNMLAEVSTTEISKEKQPHTFSESKSIAREWGDTAKKAREDIEQKTGKSAISSKNARHLQNQNWKKLR